MNPCGAAGAPDDDRAHFPSLSLLRHTEAAVINSGSTLPQTDQGCSHDPAGFGNGNCSLAQRR